TPLRTHAAINDPKCLTPRPNVNQPLRGSDALLAYERGFSLEAGDGIRTVSLILPLKQLQAWRDQIERQKVQESRQRLLGSRA
ncbi:hypothetical protein AB0J85_17990, partial [Micromonospora echinofusca]|uniref:hypothetical protein n=1 Tax=Micromonospora echinofusca TaxID=47858 RepID=UPI0034159EC9